MKNYAFKYAIVLTTVMLFSGLVKAQTTYFVSNSGDDSNNGLSWATAKATINGAMALITSPNNDSVFVAVGTYPACTVKSSTHVYGGFAGTESHLYERQPLTYGIASDSSCSIIDAQHNSNYAVSINGYMYYNNAYNCRPVDFDGFYVTGGNQYGVYSEANNTYTISNCTMTGNACGLYLGISYSNSYYSSTYQVSNCKINGNTTNGGVVMYNGSQSYAATVEFDNCVIAENTGSQFGGMKFNTYAYTTTNHIIVNNCDIVKNVASGLNAKAGGILTQSNDFDYTKTKCEWRILNSRIIDNTVYTTATTASDDNSWPYIAGGISAYTHTTHILGCVISNNSAISTEGIDVTGGVASYANGTSTSSSNTGDPVGRLYMTNCVVANNDHLCQRHRRYPNRQGSYGQEYNSLEQQAWQCCEQFKMVHELHATLHLLRKPGINDQRFRRRQHQYRAGFTDATLVCRTFVYGRRHDHCHGPVESCRRLAGAAQLAAD